MGASPKHEDPLHAALHRIDTDRDAYSPAGLASEVARAIDNAYPQLDGVLSHIVDGLICHEGASAPPIMEVLDGFVQQLAHAAVS